MTRILLLLWLSWHVPTQCAQSPKSLLVIAPDFLHPALMEFIAHKKTLLPTKLVSLEKVIADTEGVDHPEKLKRHLHAAWKNENVGYTLLVGDIDIFPGRFMVLDRKTEAAFNYAFYISDHYYADLAKPDGSFDDWNAQKEGIHARYFGEVRGEHIKEDRINYDQIDYRPEIAVGRWPVSTVEDVKAIATKSINYEQMVVADKEAYLRRAAFIVVGGWIDSRNWMDRLASRFTDKWIKEKRYYSNKSEKRTEFPPDRDQVQGLLNSGVGLAVHTGHGQNDAWEQCFFMDDALNLKNAGKLPIIVSAGCMTAHFAPEPPYQGYMDEHGHPHKGTFKKEVFTEPPPAPAAYQKGEFNHTGLGEMLIKQKDNGAVGYIGCNTGSQPCALTLVEGFVTAWSSAEIPRLGECWSSALSYYYDKENLAGLKPDNDWYPPSIFFQGMKFVLFGDPSLRLPRN